MAHDRYFASARAVTLEDMLGARDGRAALQHELLAAFQQPLICFTLNIPGQYKAFPLAEQTFRAGDREIVRELADRRFPLLHRRERAADTGYEGYYVVDAAARPIKAALAEVEDTHPLGRLFDMDVLDTDGQVLRGGDVGRPVRRCLICGGPVWECSRSRRHPADVLALRVARLMDEYFRGEFADRVARQALRAMLHELAVSPKPGLVDRFNNGAHRDMDFATFIDSAAVLQPHFRDLVLSAMDYQGEAAGLLPFLRRRGREAEAAMFAATRGVNTHKGLLFSLGLVAGGMGFLRARDLPETVDSLLGLCAVMAGGTLMELAGDGAPTHGRRVFARYGEAGVRGEAAAGFPNVRLHGLPTLRRLREQGHSLNDAGVAALLRLLANAADANILNRGGPERLADIQKRVAERLAAEPDAPALAAFADELDRECIELNISPGGCADLLAVSFMVHFLFDNA